MIFSFNTDFSLQKRRINKLKVRDQVSDVASVKKKLKEKI